MEKNKLADCMQDYLFSINAKGTSAKIDIPVVTAEAMRLLADWANEQADLIDEILS